jgi:hypothetical protein
VSRYSGALGVPDLVRNAAHHVEPTLRERELVSEPGLCLELRSTHLACQVHTDAAKSAGSGLSELIRAVQLAGLGEILQSWPKTGTRA